MGLFDIFTLGTVPKVTSVQAPTTSLYDIQIKALDGSDLSLSNLKGKKILFVNVASKCGFTYQYEELQKLSEQEKDKLVIIGLPCNQFGFQEKILAFFASFCMKFGFNFHKVQELELAGKPSSCYEHISW